MDGKMAPSKCEPAASVTLTYDLHVTTAKTVILECEQRVLRSANCTYFCCLQFWPGGYCGIQQRNGECDRLAIFSLWNDNNDNVSCINSGPDVQVSTFGGEGTGMKSMKAFQWSENIPVQFKVISERLDSGAHQVSCGYTYEGRSHHMATFSRHGAPPIRGVNSFVEDWNRCPGAKGCQDRREMVIGGVTCSVDGNVRRLMSAMFSAGSHPDEARGSVHTGAYKAGNKFCLWTGGLENSSTCASGTKICI